MILLRSRSRYAPDGGFRGWVRREKSEVRNGGTKTWQENDVEVFFFVFVAADAVSVHVCCIDCSKNASSVDKWSGRQSQLWSVFVLIYESLVA